MKPTFAKQSEHDIQSAILNILPYLGVYAWRNNSGMVAVGEGRFRRMIKLGKAGLPDIIGVQNKTGKMVGIEVKRPGKKPTDLQAQTLKELQDFGAIAFVATSVDEVQKKLNENL